MVQLNDLKEKGVFKTVIRPAEAFPEGTPEREAWEGVELTFREMTSKEATAAYGNEDQSGFLKVFRDTLVDHNIYNGEKKASVEQVLQLVESSSTVYTHCIQEWSEALPLQNKNGGSSDS